MKSDNVERNSFRSGRAKDGRFAKDNQFAVGQRDTPLRAYTDAIRDAVSPEDLRKIVAVIREQALQGNLRAAQIVLDRLTGKVRDAVHVKVDHALPDPFSLSIEDDPELRDYLKSRHPDRYGGG